MIRSKYDLREYGRSTLDLCQKMDENGGFEIIIEFLNDIWSTE